MLSQWQNCFAHTFLPLEMFESAVLPSHYVSINRSNCSTIWSFCTQRLEEHERRRFNEMASNLRALYNWMQAKPWIRMKSFVNASLQFSPTSVFPVSHARTFSDCIICSCIGEQPVVLAFQQTSRVIVSRQNSLRFSVRWGDDGSALPAVCDWFEYPAAFRRRRACCDEPPSPALAPPWLRPPTTATKVDSFLPFPQDAAFVLATLVSPNHALSVAACRRTDQTIQLPVTTRVVHIPCLEMFSVCWTQRPVDDRTTREAWLVLRTVKSRVANSCPADLIHFFFLSFCLSFSLSRSLSPSHHDRSTPPHRDATSAVTAPALDAKS